MGVNPVAGQGLAAVSVRATASAPAPQLRIPEAPGEVGHMAPRLGRQNEEQVPRLASPQDSKPRTLSGRARLRIDETSKRVVTQILDENKQVIKQIPPEELLQIAARFKRLTGLLFDERT